MKSNIIKYEENLKKMNADREETTVDAQQLLTYIEKITAELEKDDEGYDGNS